MTTQQAASMLKLFGTGGMGVGFLFGGISVIIIVNSSIILGTIGVVANAILAVFGHEIRKIGENVEAEDTLKKVKNGASSSWNSFKAGLSSAWNGKSDKETEENMRIAEVNTRLLQMTKGTLFLEDFLKFTFKA